MMGRVCRRNYCKLHFLEGFPTLLTLERKILRKPHQIDKWRISTNQELQTVYKFKMGRAYNQCRS